MQFDGDGDGEGRLVQELGRINSELAAQRRLTAEVVHDLASPLQVMLGLSELLMDSSALDPGVRGRVEQMWRSARTMSTMIDELSQGLTLEEARAVGSVPVDVVDLVTSVVERNRLLGESKSIGVLLDLPVDGEPVYVHGSADRLERAMTNLIGNAVKFSPPRSVIGVSLRRDAEVVRIAVRDDGPGISPEGQLRIFEVFHREQSTKHLPGLGLGLFITKQIVEGHGGSVAVHSETGKGATFTVTLPLAQPEALANGA